MSIDVRVDTSELQALVKQLEGLNARGISFANQRATNNVAFKVRAEWMRKAGEVLDRPRPFTRNAMLVRKASRSNPVATVFVRDEASGGIAPAVYLQQQVLGGQRRMKRSDRALQAAGLLPPGFVALPGAGITLDSNGNIRASQIKRILAAVRANQSSAGGSKPAQQKQRRGVAVFALAEQHGKLRPGVYERRGRDIKPLLVFLRAGRYQPRFDIFEYARDVLQREAVPEYRAALTAEIERALAKAARATGTGASP